MSDLERQFRDLLQPVAGQYPRPWMTSSTSPESCRVFIVGFNQARAFDAARIPSVHDYINILYNRGGTTCRGVYDELNPVPSRTRTNLDRVTASLADAGILDVIETNVICFSTPMGAELTQRKNRQGATVGRSIFGTILSHIQPKVIWLHGAGAAKAYRKEISRELPNRPSARLIQIDTVADTRIIQIGSLAPPAFNRWHREFDAVLDKATRATAEFLSTSAVPFLTIETPPGPTQPLT